MLGIALIEKFQSTRGTMIRLSGQYQNYIRPLRMIHDQNAGRVCRKLDEQRGDENSGADPKKFSSGRSLGQCSPHPITLLIHLPEIFELFSLPKRHQSRKSETIRRVE